jgi:hypothetical protein
MRRTILAFTLLAATAAQAQATEILPVWNCLPASKSNPRQRRSQRRRPRGCRLRRAQRRFARAYRGAVGEGRLQPRLQDRGACARTTEFAPGTLTLDGNVLKFEDMTGGTTAISSTRRFRYDGRGEQMRLIGLDATVYSRTYAHDGFETSWNLLNGDTHHARAQAQHGRRRRGLQPRPAAQLQAAHAGLWLADSPDPETVLEEMRDG